MKEFFRLQRVPRYKLANAPLPISQEFHRKFTLLADWGNSAHRLYVLGLFRNLVDIDRKLQLVALAALAREGVLETIHSFHRTRAKGAFQPDLVDLYYLYDHIRKHRPKVVLELGSGISTAVMAHALAKNGEGHVFSLEASEEWAKSTASSITSDIRPYATVQYRQPVAVNVLGHATYCFEDPPIDTAELIYIDGAAHDDAIFQGAENLDFMDLRPGTCIYIDSRVNAVEYFKRKMAAAERGTLATPLRYQIHCYMVVVGGVPESPWTPFEIDQFSNTLVQVV